MVRKQVMSNAAKGIPAKLVLREKGPYKVRGRVPLGNGALSKDSYLVQKIPATSTMSPGAVSKVRKESAFRMHKVPSTIVIHKRVDTSDTRLAQLRHPLSHSPLEQQLGLIDFGKYAKAPPTAEHAFDKIQDIWNDEGDPEPDSSDDEIIESTPPDKTYQPTTS